MGRRKQGKENEFEELQDQSSSVKNKELARVQQPRRGSQRKQNIHRREVYGKSKRADIIVKALSE